MDKEDVELPVWVKFVNKLLHGRRKWEEEKRNFDEPDDIRENL